MNVKCCSGSDEVAKVYLADLGGGRFVEFVESVQRPMPRRKKWVLIVSSLCGCPIRCQMCDAGSYYRGSLSRQEIESQIEFLVRRRFPRGKVPVEKFKIQFARMGEPSLNPAVLDVLQWLPERFPEAGLLPSLSTIAPAGRGRFFLRLAEIKERLFDRGRFQLQFSIHSTDPDVRDRLLPVPKWDFARIAAFGESFQGPLDKKITLNFALMADVPIDEKVLLRHFDPDRFLVKITPLNPTYRAEANRLSADHESLSTRMDGPTISRIRRAGYEVIHSIGDLEESLIGSNCGQSLFKHLRRGEEISGGYRYRVNEMASLTEREETGRA